MTRALVATCVGVLGAASVAGPAQAGVWIHATTNPYGSEAECDAAGSRYVAHYCTFTTYPKDCGRCGVRGWYLSYYLD
ncbi:hypothetical protein ACFY2R_11595 [Micromonospora olivasterospora]|uniref:Secreted protein n=1 Tax=Micromonospora olivasterospora TaxID=1880 RepID=A0A562I3F9_MICOL|nr:hypothetical protein [Micromonospora olivasterospora]TWH65587.1 hypothetical protein JD77_00524 [Micromonospora olivasterospora]